jgi:hypothetical protein
MRPNRRATNIPVRWQPYAELTAAAAAACGGEGSILDTSLLGGGRYISFLFFNGFRENNSVLARLTHE